MQGTKPPRRQVVRRTTCVPPQRGYTFEQTLDLFLAEMGDRVGIKPMYYRETEHGLLYGSELKSILAADQVSPSLNPSAIFAM